MPATPTLNQAELEKAVHEALSSWRKSDNLTLGLFAHLLLVQAQQETLPDDSSTASRLAMNHVLLDALKELEKQNPERARILNLRFIEDQKTLMVANQLGFSEDQVKRGQKEAIQQLTQIILKKETAVRKARSNVIEAILEPSTYTTLYGADEIRQTLVEQVLQHDAPWMIALIGIGGIGKTALADAVARQVIGYFHYERVIWLRVTSYQPSGTTLSPEKTLNRLVSQLIYRLAPQMTVDISPEQQKLRVRQFLKAAPYLVVIDNLEDEADTAYLLAQLHDWANPSKFLLTTRTRPPTQSGMFAFYLQELPYEASAQLIRHQAQETGLQDLATASDQQLRTIYEAVGGNPLALKLVVGLASTLPLSHILEDLLKVRSREITEMYRYIYWQAWQSLRLESRELLEKMPLTDEVGAKPEQLTAISELGEGKLWAAISELVHFSLLEVRGTAWDRRYGIHQLTRSFLLTEIIHWPEAI